MYENDEIQIIFNIYREGQIMNFFPFKGNCNAELDSGKKLQQR